jgi:sulfopyruvate decarboxylase subunit beta
MSAAGGGAALTLGEVVEALAETQPDAIAVTGPGAAAGQLFAADPERPGLYNMELAYATPTAFGLALAVPERRVVALEGDGSLLAGLGSLATVARYRPPNLTIVAIDNGIYGTGDNSVATQTALGADLVAVALGLGWPNGSALRVADRDELRTALADAGQGPRLVVAAVDPASYPRSGVRVTPGVDVVESAVLLRMHLDGRLGREGREP